MGALIVRPHHLGIDSIKITLPGGFSKCFSDTVDGKNPMDSTQWVEKSKRRLRAGSDLHITFTINEQDIKDWKEIGVRDLFNLRPVRLSLNFSVASKEEEPVVRTYKPGNSS